MTPLHDPVEPIAVLYTDLVDDLSTTLDLAAGSADATRPHHLARLAADLHDTLDLAAGLAAIVGPPNQDTETATASHPQATASPEGSWVTRLIDQLKLLDLPARLVLRTAAASAELSSSLDLADALTFDRVLDRLNSALDSAHNADDLPGAGDLDRARDLADDLADDLDRGRDLDRALALHHDLARDPNLAATLAGAHLRARAVARDLKRYASRLDRGRALPSDRAAAYASADELNHAIAHIHAGVRALAHEAASTVARLLGLRLEGAGDDETSAVAAADLRHLRQVLDDVTNDFAGVDLRSTALDGVSLERIRWSAATRWPPKWDKRVRAASAEIAPGVFEVTGGWGREHRGLDVTAT